MYFVSIYQAWYIHPCTLLKFVNDYDLIVRPMSVMGFQKKFGCGCVGGVSSIQVYFEFLEFD